MQAFIMTDLNSHFCIPYDQAISIISGESTLQQDPSKCKTAAFNFRAPMTLMLKHSSWRYLSINLNDGGQRDA